MMSYNPTYYPRLVEQYGGFEKSQDLYAYVGDMETLKRLRSERTAMFIVEEAKRRFNVQIRQIDKAKFDQEIRMFLDIYNRAFVGHWGFVPLSEGEVVRISSELKHLIAPELTSVAEVDGEPIGCVFALPDYNPRIKKIDGRLFPTGLIRLLWNRQAISRVRMIATNVVPEYQRWGIGLVLLNEIVPAAIKWGIKQAEFSWIMESNRLSLGTVERSGCVRTSTYRLYDRDLTDDAGET
jgi:GNAT superfamily N-acetyltransferase